MLRCFDDFLLPIESKARAFTSPDTTSSSGVMDSIKIVNHSINLYTPQGFSTLICVNIIAGITTELNIMSKKYKFKRDKMVAMVAYVISVCFAHYSKILYRKLT